MSPERTDSWFEELFGFAETSYEETRSQFALEGTRLRSLANGRSFAVGQWSTPTLAELREQVRTTTPQGTLRVSHELVGDVLELHALPQNQGALFQVASQFNCLEFPDPRTVPEHGVTSYAHDPTQGPACSLAAAAATVYRNYFAPVPAPVPGAPARSDAGQTTAHQIDNLDALARTLGQPGEFWHVENGYTFSSTAQLAALRTVLDKHDREELLGQVKIGLQRDVGVTFSDRFTPLPTDREPLVSQAFCSAISCAYSGLDPDAWQPLANLVLEASYEATLWAAASTPRAKRCNKVWLTFLGGGAFGNRSAWIADALGRALRLAANLDLDVRIAHHHTRNPELEQRITHAAR